MAPRGVGPLKIDRNVKVCRKRSIMTDKDDGAVGPTALGHEQTDELASTIRVQRRGGLVGENQFRLPDQSACGSDTLLLPNAQIR